jgi:hypothetical protein
MLTLSHLIIIILITLIILIILIDIVNITNISIIISPSLYLWSSIAVTVAVNISVRLSLTLYSSIIYHSFSTYYISSISLISSITTMTTKDAQPTPSKSPLLDCTRLPHLFDLIIAYSPFETIAALRQTSRAIKDHVEPFCIALWLWRPTLPATSVAKSFSKRQMRTHLKPLHPHFQTGRTARR